MKKNFGLIFVIFAVTAVGLAFGYAKWVGLKADEGVVVREYTKGNEGAAARLDVYSDFQCPACAQFQSLTAEIMSEYADRLAITYHHFPLISIHPNAVPAAKAAEAAGQQDKFWEMVDMLYSRQSEWSTMPNPQLRFEAYAEELSLDLDLFKTHMKSSLLENKIKQDFDEARTLGLTGTPTFFLNGERMNFTSFDEFISQIEGALGIADSTTSSATNTVPAIKFGF